jgi:NADPH:quinone reductase-like Zn-dependent oxidoreductase
MKAYQIHDFTGIDALRLDDVPDPQPGPGQVLVSINAVSLNFRDLMVCKGFYNPKFPRPLQPVSDAAGVVLEVGAGVTDLKPGDRVVAGFMPGWREGSITDAKVRSALGGESAGLLAQLAVLPASGLVPIPAHLSFEQAATLPCAGVTAWNALFESHATKPGETVLTMGTGGVSIFAIQLARIAGARVIATSSSDDKLERVLAMGASDGINYKTVPDWEKKVRELTGGLGVDHVIEVGGAGTLPRSIDAVRRGGTISLIGVLTGATSEVNPMPILMKSVKVNGIFVGSVAMLASLLRALETNKLDPVIDRVFEFEQAQEAYRYMESGAHFGKVVIRVG